MIFNDSRYYDGSLAQIKPKGGDQNTIAVYRKFPVYSSLLYSEYVWKDGDSIDVIAYEYLGDSFLWWVIMDYNQNILDPNSILPGTVIRIPNG